MNDQYFLAINELVQLDGELVVFMNEVAQVWGF
jgi:hypothetical protein